MFYTKSKRQNLFYFLLFLVLLTHKIVCYKLFTFLLLLYILCPFFLLLFNVYISICLLKYLKHFGIQKLLFAYSITICIVQKRREKKTKKTLEKNPQKNKKERILSNFLNPNDLLPKYLYV